MKFLNGFFKTTHARDAELKRLQQRIVALEESLAAHQKTVFTLEDAISLEPSTPSQGHSVSAAQTARAARVAAPRNTKVAKSSSKKAR